MCFRERNHKKKVQESTSMSKRCCRREDMYCVPGRKEKLTTLNESCMTEKWLEERKWKTEIKKLLESVKRI